MYVYIYIYICIYIYIYIWTSRVYNWWYDGFVDNYNLAVNCLNKKKPLIVMLLHDLVNKFMYFYKVSPMNNYPLNIFSKMLHFF